MVCDRGAHWLDSLSALSGSRARPTGGTEPVLALPLAFLLRLCSWAKRGRSGRSSLWGPGGPAAACNRHQEPGQPLRLPFGLVLTPSCRDAPQTEEAFYLRRCQSTAVGGPCLSCWHGAAPSLPGGLRSRAVAGPLPSRWPSTDLQASYTMPCDLWAAVPLCVCEHVCVPARGG